MDLDNFQVRVDKKYPEITKYTTIWMDTLRDGKTRAF